MPSLTQIQGSIDETNAAGTQTLSEEGREGRKAGRERKGNDKQIQKPSKTQGGCTDLRGPCIKTPGRSHGLRYQPRIVTKCCPAFSPRTSQLTEELYRAILREAGMPVIPLSPY